MYQWIIFIVASLIILAISWKSLQQPGSHGFYRFFAWEAILALFVINVNFWFYQAIRLEPDHRMVAAVPLFHTACVWSSFPAHTWKTCRAKRRRSLSAGVREDHNAGDKRHLSLHPPSALQFLVSAGVGHLL